MKTTLRAAVRKALLPAVCAILASGLAALAANTTFFTSIGDIVFPLGAPTAAGQNGSIGDPARGGMAPVNGNLSYTKTVASSLFNLMFGNFQREMLLEPAGTLAYGYATFAPAPVDGTQQCLFSTQQVTTFYLNANAGQTLNNAITQLAANVRYCYTYSLGNTTWDRSQ